MPQVFVISTKMESQYSWPWVERQVAQTANVWIGCARRALPPLPRLTHSEQRKHEKAYDEGLRRVERETRRIPHTLAGRALARQRIVDTFPPFAAVALGLAPDAVNLLSGTFLRVGTELARWARGFDPELSVPDTIQACRNMWTACGLQGLLGQTMQLTPSLIAYSLLYPYSDNYLDQPSLSTTDKLLFSARFRQRLSGQQLAARDRHEAAVWQMVQLIEEQYPRLHFPQVYNCLLAIHRGQEESMAQLGAASSERGALNDHELLRISCSKGGTSVLADACLVQPWLSDEESRFAFEWGVLLQLGDDLQDVKDDLRRGSATLFARAAAAGQPLDGLVTQLLNFSQHVASSMAHLPLGSATLKDLLRMSWRSLILMAVSDSQQFFSRAFLTELESCSTFRFSFLRDRNKNLVAREALYTRLFDAFVETAPDAPDALPVPPLPTVGPTMQQGSVARLEPDLADKTVKRAWSFSTS